MATSVVEQLIHLETYVRQRLDALIQDYPQLPGPRNLWRVPRSLSTS